MLRALIASIYMFLAASFVTLFVIFSDDISRKRYRRRSNELRNVIDNSKNEISVFVMIQMITFLILLTFGFDVPNAFFYATATGICYPIYKLMKRRRARRNIDREIEQLLVNLGSALFVNPSIQHALVEAAQEAEPMMKNEIQRVITLIENGCSQGDALAWLAKRLNDDVFELAINGISICRETGGGLGNYLTRLAELKRSRRYISGRIDAMSSQQRTTAKIVTLIPIVFIGLIWIANRSFANYFYSPLGFSVIAYSVISISLGFVLMNRMTKLVPGGRSVK